MAVSKRLRYEILRRDNHACRYCGLAAPDVKLTVDHVVPTALGGSDDPSNLVAACKDCNAGKSASAPDAALVADVSSDAVRWARVMEAVTEKRCSELAVERGHIESFDHDWTMWKTSQGAPVPRSAGWQDSVLRFLAQGLDHQFFRDAIRVAMENKKLHLDHYWRYFCGICWRELDKRREMATVALRESPVVPAATPDDRLPYGPGLHPGFDALNLADSFIADLLAHVGTDHEVLKWATRGFWDGMETAYKAFIDGPGSHESAEERADEEFSNTTAWYMAQIRGLCQGQVSDGEE